MIESGNSKPAAGGGVRRLRKHLKHVMSRDLGSLSRSLSRLERGGASVEAVQQLEAELQRSQAQRDARRQRVPAVEIDENLPVAAHAEALVEAIRRHPVIIVAGETGSGKSTQLPKLCLAAGRGTAGLIGCTQPRRIAARSVAARVAEELKTSVGDLVGFQVRFNEKVSPDSLIKFMTDGILLAETRSDRWLTAYDTLIIDEAHERSLNIDFLIGYLKGLLRRRRDLRVIITSATIDTARFAEHFESAPVITVEGRGYPVETRYRPLEQAGENGEDLDLLDGIAAAIDELGREDARGDVLVFLPGEREIRDVHLGLSRRKLRHTEVLPLYARLSAKDQDRVFQPGPQRRIVLATNVAETSLTVPRIRFVIDSGTARISRYSPRSKVQRLHVEPISQASANQRAGRCGRVAPGIAIRLYSEQDFDRRPEWTDPEILRSSLAGVILRMEDLRLGDPRAFPFIDAPGDRAINDGLLLLQELQALDSRKRLTDIGRTLTRFPLDVKLGRMLVEAQRLGCLAEVLVIASGLSIPDPRERPADRRALADAAHSQWAHPESDYLALVNLWNHHEQEHAERSRSGLRDWCISQFLSPMRMREWRELHRQLVLVCRELGWSLNAPTAEQAAVHKAVLSGLATQIGQRDERNVFEGARGRRFQLFPGSHLAKKPPRWVVSFALLDTQKVWAMVNARIEPEWLEEIAPHLLKFSHFDPWWDSKRGQVMVWERVSLGPLVLVTRRRRAYAAIDPVDARRVFIAQALVAGELSDSIPFVAHNRQVLAEAEALEQKLRRSGLRREADELAAWFDARLPAQLLDTRSLQRWAQRDAAAAAGMQLDLHDVLLPEALSGGAEAFPDHIDWAGQRLRLSYQFEPGSDADGVTVQLPLALLNLLPAARMDWLVPGLVHDRVVALIKSLPKSLRRNFVPTPDFARAFLETGPDVTQAMAEQLARFLSRIAGVELSAESFAEVELPTLLQMRIALLDQNGETMAQGRDLEALRRSHAEAARRAFAAQVAGQWRRDDLRGFDIDDLPESVHTEQGLRAYPALVEQGESAVGLRLFETEQQARTAHRAGLKRLLRQALEEKLRYLSRKLPISRRGELIYAVSASVDTLRADIAEAALDALMNDEPQAVRSRMAFAGLVTRVGSELVRCASERAARVERALEAVAELKPWFDPPLIGFAAASYDDARQQLDSLVYPGFARHTPDAQLSELPRYLEALRIRLERLRIDPVRDQQRMLDVQPYDRFWRQAPSRESANPDAVQVLRWMCEEFRVSLFAQELGTAQPVSPKRMERALRKASA